MARSNHFPGHLDKQGRSRPSLDLPFIQSLLDRKVREQTGLFWAEGCRSLHNAIECGRQILVIGHCRELLRSRSSDLALRHLRKLGTPVLELEPEEFISLSRQEEPQGIGIVAQQLWQPLIQVAPKGDELWIVLDNVRTPGNLGTILRTCAAVGAEGVMLIGGETDPHDPACVRGSMGAIFRQKLVRTSAKALLGWRAHHACTVIGTSPAAKACYRNANYKRPLLLMMGSERHGIRERQLSLCDTLVSLPMADNVDSLNLAVATGVILYEALAHRDNL